MDENIYNLPFELILSAGNSKSHSLLSIESARQFNFEEAEKCLEEAEKELLAAHKVQSGMIQQEAQGNPTEVNVILVHAQDHLAMAMMAKDFAEEFVNIYKIIAELKSK